MKTTIPESHYQLYKDYALDHFKCFDCYPFQFAVESDNNGPIDHYNESQCQQMLDRLLSEITPN